MSRHRNIKNGRRLKLKRLFVPLGVMALIAAALTVFMTGTASADSVPGCPADAETCEVPVIPANDWTVDDCNPEGVNFNAYWSLPEDADVEGVFDFVIEENDHLLVRIVTGYQRFSDGSLVHDYGLPQDSGKLCDPDPVDPTIVDIPAAPKPNDPCGPNNASWNAPSDDATFHWLVNGEGHLVVSIVADNTEFTDGSTSHDYGAAPDSGKLCDPDPGDETMPISAKALNDHGCDSSEWHFVITQVDSEADAPSSIHVTWANGNEADLPLDKYTGKTAHYSTTANLGSTVTSATADVYSDWSGQFNLSHGPCEVPPPVDVCPNIDGNQSSVPDGMIKDEAGNCVVPPPTVIDVPAKPSVTDLCGPNNASWNLPVDTDTLHWAISDEGHLVVSIVADGLTFPGGDLMHDYGVAPDSGTTCPPTEETITPLAPSVTEPSCEVPNITVTPSSQDGVVWNPSGNSVLEPGQSVTYTATPDTNYVFPKDAQVSWTFSNTFDTEDCVVINEPPQNPQNPGDDDTKCASGLTWFDNNHNGVVDNGECAKSAVAETGLGAVNNGHTNQPASSAAPMRGLVVGVLLLMVGAFIAIYRPSRRRSE